MKSVAGSFAMSLNILFVALVHAAVVLMVAAVTRSRGWTVVAAVAVASVALAWGHAADVAEKWVAIGLGYWACWRMLPRKKFPRRARSRKTNRFKVRSPALTGLGGAMFTIIMVTVVSVATGLPSRTTKRPTPVPAVAVPVSSSSSSVTTKQQSLRWPALSLM